MHPRAPPVPPDLHVAPREQARAEAVADSRKHGSQDEATGPVLPAPDPPCPDLAVLVGAQDGAVARGEDTLHGAFARGNNHSSSTANFIVFFLISHPSACFFLQRPHHDAAVRRGAVQRVAVEGEGGDVGGGVASESGDALVERRAYVRVTGA
jgi:hypothetical protein